MTDVIDTYKIKKKSENKWENIDPITSGEFKTLFPELFYKINSKNIEIKNDECTVDFEITFSAQVRDVGDHPLDITERSFWFWFGVPEDDEM